MEGVNQSFGRQISSLSSNALREILAQDYVKELI